MNSTLAGEVTIENDRLHIANKSVPLKNIWLVSIRRVSDLKLVVLVILMGLFLLVGLLCFGNFTGADAASISFPAMFATIIVTLVAIFLVLRRSPAKQGYNVCLRTNGFSRMVTRNPLNYQAAEQLARALVDAIEFHRKQTTQSNKPETQISGIPFPNEEVIPAYHEPLLAGNEISIKGNILLSGGQALPLMDIEQIDRSQVIPSDAFAVGGIAMLIVPITAYPIRRTLLRSRYSR